ncbi:P-loop containing nucleoside triphosphate hydrolase protein [Dentipellis sp. KUC8613]|nr:P-loop containing nucleoside triphosphate hydrolase protein [Dentipellis sp. KUC8613]
MPRRKPASSKQRKAELQLKRARKRADLSQPNDAQPPSSKPSLSAQPTTVSARRLQSAFLKLSPDLLEQSKVLSARLTLPRPLLSHVVIWPVHSGRIDAEKEDEMRTQMSCMKRPKWRYEMTKKEVEKNEEGLFAKWITKTDQIVDNWVQAAEEQRLQLVDPAVETMPPSPSIFERNLEVWRQLWRVTELSQILLILLDSRCPLLHYPPSLSAYLSSVSARLILVLTKVDISGHERASAWARYLTAKFPGVRVVMVESYMQKTSDPDDGGGNMQGRPQYKPHIPESFKSRLIQAMKEIHAEMLQPPERIRHDEAKVKKWNPRVKLSVNWEAVMTAKPKMHIQREDAPLARQGDENEDDEYVEPEYLTVGLVGQPNVGKSSLLNALFGMTKARASKTPGKTKHFQTLFWTSDIRLVDCPGLVLPNLVPLEMQVLGGVLPIARMPAIPLCIAHAARLLPLESILGLTHPSQVEPEVEDKRTWREGKKKDEKKKEIFWTAMDVLTAFADKKGWVTAKAGRPDVNRAGNAILRMLAEGRIKWAFWPPDVEPAVIEDAAVRGIWIPADIGDSDSSDSEEEPQDQTRNSEDESSEDKEEGDGSESKTVAGQWEDTKAASRFALLQVDDKDSDDDEND